LWQAVLDANAEFRQFIATLPHDEIRVKEVNLVSLRRRRGILVGEDLLRGHFRVQLGD
jgi:hypothetical protein